MTGSADLLARRAEVSADTSLRGRALCRALSDATDAWLAALLDEATGGDHHRIALVAVGGYGRGELAPWSDLDVWLIHAGRGDVREVAERVWYPVWDSGLKLGHAVRTQREALSLAGSDLDTATAALSSRFVAGDEAVVRGLAATAADRWRRKAGKWLIELRRRVQSRHAAAGEVAFLLEPDLKEGRGGLRDIHALRWAESARPVLVAGDSAALHDAEDVLLAARVAVHRIARKPSDLLLLERQDEVAAALGLPDADALVAQVSAAARTVAWVSDEAWQRIEVGLGGSLRRRVFERDRQLERGLLLREGEIHLTAGADVVDPVLVLRTAAAAATNGARIGRATLNRLAESSPVLEGTWPDAAREAFVALLGAGSDALPVIEALDQRRIFERVLPEWSNVRSKPQRNALHRFTVDRHLCEATANAAGLASTVARPDLLLVGTLLHDIGKGWPGDHTEVGIELVRDIGTRMGFPPDDVELLVGMVRHHLLLPDVATRRDLSDDDVIESVAAQVGSLSLLELLAVLTESDSLATGPSAWGPWKAGLVEQLVDRVAHVLRGGEASEVTAGEDFPDAPALELLRQGRTVVEADPPTITVVAPDRPGVFSKVAGTLSLRGLTVLAADAGGAEGMAASRFLVAVEPHDDVDWDAVGVDVCKALEGRLALDARLAQRARSYRRAPAAMSLVGDPSVRIDNTASGTATVVEVRAPDRIGVLYRITRALADLDLDIQKAKATTLGHEVVDAFYVRTAAGGKVVDREHLQELERAILHQLSLL